MALTYRPDEAEIIRSVINGVKGEEPKVQDEEFFCLDYTSFCSGSCLYCERSRNNWDLKRERMTPDEILEELKKAYDKGFRRFFLYAEPVQNGKSHSPGGIKLCLDDRLIIV